MADKTVLLALKVTGDDDGASKSLTNVGNASSTASSKMSKAGSIAGKVLAVGIAAAGAAAVAATKAAAEDEQAQVKLATAYKNNANATDAQIAASERWIAVQGKTLGVADDDLRPALGKLVTITHDVGKAQKLASLAMDISAGSGKSLASVTQALVRAKTGETTSLSKYGIEVEKANGKTISFRDATKKLADTFGGSAAAAADTAAGKQKILEVQMGELQETIGAKLLPVMLKLTNAGLAAIDWMTQHATATKVLAGVVVGLVTTVFVVGKAIQAWSAITRVATGVQAAFNVVMAANPIVLVTVAIVALGVALVVAYKKSETFRNIVNGAFKAVVGAGKAVIDFFKNNWKKVLFVLLTGPVGLAVIFIKAKGGAIKSAIIGFAKGVLGFLKANWKKALLLLLTGPFGAAILLIRSKASAIKSTVSNMVSAVVGFFRSRWRDIIGLAGSAIDAARDKVSAGADRIVSAVSSKVSKVVSFFRGLPGKLKGALGDLGHLLYNAGVAIIQGLWDGLQDKWDDVKSWIGGITDQIPDIKGPPSKDAVMLYDNGKLIMGGLERGLDVGSKRVLSKLHKLNDAIKRSISATVNDPVNLAGNAGASAAGGIFHAGAQGGLAAGLFGRREVRITINGAVDAHSTAKQIRDLLDRQDMWRGRVRTT